MSRRHLPDEAERLKVREAIAAAEKQTIGEIFAVVAREADDYRLIPLLWATLVALVVPLPLLFVSVPADWLAGAAGDWGGANAADVPLPAGLIFLIQVVVFIVLAIVLLLPGIKPLVIPESVKRGRAHALASEQFLAHGLHTTEARTGVLIFVSLFERYAEIVADAGIAAKVEQAVWDESLAQLLAEIRAGRLADGLVGAIGRAGTVLAVHFPPRPRDRNELPNDLVIL
jgi:putative membrane protein